MAKRGSPPSCPDWWDDQQDGEQERRQREAVLVRLVAEDCQRPPTAEMARRWHRDLFTGIAPHPDYPGNFRHLDDDGPPCLYGVLVFVGNTPGRPPGQVAQAVEQFIAEFQERVSRLDASWEEKGGRPGPDEVFQMLRLAAWAHGEWVRIHPFINGNGRTSRLWGNYVFCRYGFAPLAIRPRPGGRYGEAAHLSMRAGDHTLMAQVYADLLRDQLEDGWQDVPS